MSVTVLPSYPAPDWEHLVSVLQNLQGVATEFQIDLVDGQFVPSTSWPLTMGSESLTNSLASLQPFLFHYIFEFDCMVEHPEQYLDALVAAGGKRIIIHYGSTKVWSEIVRHAAAHGYQLGLAITNEVAIDSISALVDDVAFVQVMGIAQVGQQGQPFDERTITTIANLRSQFPNLTIAVDGSVNADTVPQLVKAGATRLAPGSALTLASDPVAAYKQLMQLANDTLSV